MKNKINTAIVGYGVIGSALGNWIEKNNSKNCNILKIDPMKGFNDDIQHADVIFVSIHVPTEEDGSQNLNDLEEIIKNAPDVPIFIRTTVIPGTCKKLSKKYKKDVNFMPEFLTERTALEDFENQPMVFTNHEKLLKKIFPHKKYVLMSSLEAEVTKYAHNVFGALKVTYFNGIYEYCKKLNIDYNNVLKGVLLSGYINSPHTQVPGPDSKFGYGGKCFPKDVNAFIEAIKKTELNKIISLLPKINKKYRNQS